MARLNTYPNDENVSGSDKVIGTDANTGGTKNFTLSSVSNWMNDAGAVKILGQSNYVFQGDGAAPRRVATISVEDYSNNVAFSDVTQLIFSQNPAGGHDIVPYLNAIIGKKIIIGNLTYLENFGIYTLFSVEEFEPGFYTLELGFVEGSGALYDEGAYGFAPWALEPLDALDLQDVTDIGSTTTHGITTGGLDVTGINRITIGDATNYFGGGGLQIGGTGFSAAKMHLITSTTGTGSITFGDGLYADTLQGIVSYDHSSNAMYFVTARAERLRIDGDGNVGIGTTSPEYLLDISGDNIRVGVHTFGHGGSDVTTNLAIGQNALDAHSGSTGSAVAIGPGALQYSTDASYATAIGEFSGANDNGTQNTFIGAYTGPYYYALTGGYNTMVGSQAGIQMSGTAGVNTGIGNGALYNLSTGNDNTALGQSAGSGITTGSGNIMIGVGNNGISTGSNNVIIGRFTGLAAGLSNNVIIGDGAGNKRIVFNDLGELQIPDLTAGYLKSDADGNITVDTDTIEDTLDSVTTRDNITTNAITVGGLTVDTDTLHVDATNNRVGIGTTSPIEKLHISGGNILLESQYGVRFNDGNTRIYTNDDSPEDLIIEADQDLLLNPDGNVGIGTTSPLTNLHIANSGAAAQLSLERIDTSDTLKLVIGSSYGYLQNTSGPLSLGTTNDNQQIYIATDGDVGIGTTSPSNKLHVVGDARIEGNLTVNGTYTQVDTDTLTTEQWNVTNDGTGPAVTINQTGAQDIMDVQDDGTSVFYIEDGGNVGIGTTDPVSTLTVLGTTTSGITVQSGAASSGLKIFNNSTTDEANIINHYNGPLILGTSNSERMRIDGAGNVGIGTTGPENKLHVNGTSRFRGSQFSSQSNSLTGLIIDSSNITHSSGSYGAGIEFTKMGSGVYKKAGIVPVGTGSDNDNLGLSLQVSQSSLQADPVIEALRLRHGGGMTLAQYGSNTFTGTAAYALAVDSSGNVIETAVQSSPTGGSGTTNYVAKWNTSSTLGDSGIYDNGTNVGIGTTSPASKLHVNGNVTIGNIGTTAPQEPLMVKTKSDAYFPAIKVEDYNSEEGLYIQNIDGYNTGIGTGRYYNSGFWRSDLTVPTSIRFDQGVIRFYAQSGVTADADYTPFERMRIAANGRVGIGTTSPQQELEIVGAIRISEDIEWGWGGVKIVGSTSTNDFRIKTWNGSSPEDRVIVDGSGNVGIGTTTPLSWAALHVNGTIHSPSLITTDDKLRVRGAGQSDAVIIDGDGDTYFNGGNVGIGTTSPGARLQINGSTSDTTASALVLRNSSLTSLFSVRNDGRVDIAAGALVHSGGGYANTSTSSSYFTGNVGIGTTSPGHKLDVGGSININNTSYAYKINDLNVLSASGTYTNLHTPEGAVAIYLGDSGDRTNYYDNNTHRFRGAGGSGDKMFINSSGNVGIGTTSPNHKLDIYSNENVPLRVHRPNNANLDSSGAWGIGFSTRSDGNNSVTDTRAGIFSYYNGNLFLAAANTSIVADPDAYARLTILNSGNVGIGTTSPAVTLHVNGFARLNGSLQLEGNNRYVYAINDTSLLLGTNNTERMRITNTGNVGIGLTNPLSPLSVKSNSVSSSTSGFTLISNATNNIVAAIGERATDGGRFHLYDAGVEKVAFYSDGTNNHISAGNVGIGTTSPLTTLHSYSTQASPILAERNIENGNVSVQFKDQTSSWYAGKASNGNFGISRSANLGASTVFNITATDRVGIGTTTPTAPLHIEGGVTNEVLKVEADANPFMRFVENGTNVGFIQFTGSSAYVSNMSNGSLLFRTNNTDKVAITGTGNVGIGTTSPGAELHVKGAGEVFRLQGDTGQSYMTFFQGTGSRVGYLGTAGSAGIILESSDQLQLYAGSSEVIRITSSGNVGIGTTSPSRQLELRGQGVIRLNAISGGDPGLDFNTSDVNDMQIRYRSTTDALAIYSYGTSSDVLTIRKSDGNVGIGTTSPGQKLHVNGNILVNSKIYGTGTGWTYYEIANSDYHHSFYTRTDVGANLERFTIEGGAVDGRAYFLNTNVGIGTTSPAAKLVVAGTAYINQTSDYFGVSNTKVQISAGSSSDNVGIRSDKLYLYSYGNGTDSQLIFGDGQAHWALFANDNRFSLYNYATSATSIHVSNTGNVGIGTTSPQAKFHAIGHTMFSGGGYSTAYNSQNGLVIDSSNVTSAASTYGAGIEFTRLGDSTIKKAGIVPVQETADSDSIGLSFHTARTTTTTDPTFEVMRLSHDSKVGIGSSSPSSKLEVNGTAMSQLRMVTAGGPSSSSDTSGNIGDLAYDADHLYIKTSNGWGRVALDFAF